MDSGDRARSWVLTGPGGRLIATDVRWARTSREKRRGLIGSPPLPQMAALVIERARQVHTFGMSFSIDVVFCDEDWVVRHVVHRMRPARLTRPVLSARYVLELTAGAAAAVKPRDRLQLSPRPSESERQD